MNRSQQANQHLPPPLPANQGPAEAPNEPPSASFVSRLQRLRSIAPTEAPGESLAHSPLVQIGAQLPAVRTKRSIAMLEEPNGARAAGYRVLRHHLPPRDDGRARVTIVSSAVAGEATTRCAINLALALNDYHRRRVLLIDANFTKPGVATALGMHKVPCFAAQLANRSQAPTTPWTVVELVPPRLHVLPLGAVRGQRQPLYETAYAEAFVSAMETLGRAGYEHIVAAAPPVLESAQPTLMQEAADGVILTCRRGQSRTKTVQRGIQQFGRDAVVGLVLELG